MFLRKELSVSYFMLEKLQLAHSGGLKQPFNLTAAVNILTDFEGSARLFFFNKWHHSDVEYKPIKPHLVIINGFRL